MMWLSFLPLAMLTTATSVATRYHPAFHLEARLADASSNYTASVLSLTSDHRLIFRAPGTTESASALSWYYDPDTHALVTSIPFSSADSLPYRLSLNADDREANTTQPGDIYTWVGLQPGKYTGARFGIEAAGGGEGRVVFEDGISATFAICPGGALFRRPASLSPHFSCEDAELRAVDRL